MPSTPPPLPRPYLGSTPRRAALIRSPGELRRINWPVILASASVSFALVAGVFAWIVSHPHKAAPPLQVTKIAAIEPVAVAPVPPVRVIAATPAFHHSPPREAISDKILLMEVNPPPLPPPVSPEPKQPKDKEAKGLPPGPQQPPLKQPTGETYGTQVLFLNNRETAADTARREHKLLFVMHISGNFEDSCFT